MKTWGSLSGNVDGTLVMSRQSLARMAAEGKPKATSSDSIVPCPDDDRTLIMRRSVPNQRVAGLPDPRPTIDSISDVHRAYEPPHSSAPEPKPAEPTSGPRTRLFAFLALCAVMAGFGYVGHTAYRAMSDSFVAPMILSPDSDIVVENKAKLTELEMNRTQAVGEAEGIEADLASTEKGISRLTELQGMASNSLDWTRNMTAHQAASSGAELGALGAQAGVLSGMLAKQRDLTNKAKENMEAGIITGADLAREEQSLNQMQLALLENGRTRVQAQLQMHQAQMGQDSLSGHAGAPPMPEVIAAEDQLVRVDLELLKLEAEKQSKLAERKSVEERIAKLDDLEAQLKSRPLFQAIEKNMDVAFVPYAQIDGVKKGAAVYECVLGFFGCKEVGTVAEVVPGEVTLPDPWGNPARGQYAVLDLRNHDSAKAKSLRVRSTGKTSGGASQPARMQQGQTLSVK